MKLRFEVDQAECLRAGIDCPKSIVTVEVDPAELNQEQRNLLADRLSGIDVCQLWNDDKGTKKAFEEISMDEWRLGKNPKPIHIVANAPTFEALMKAIEENEVEVNERKQRHRHVALGMAEISE